MNKAMLLMFARLNLFAAFFFSSFAIGNNPVYSLSEVSVNLPDIELVGTRGESHVLDKVLDPTEPILLQFVFSSCGNICPILSASLRAVQHELKGKANLVSVSIDPEFDTPRVLADYSKQFEAQSHWRFYTGDLGDIVVLQHAFGVYQNNKMRHQWVTFIYNGSVWHKLEGAVTRQDLINEFERLTVLSK
jgi:protein SCO1/2